MSSFVIDIGNYKHDNKYWLSTIILETKIREMVTLSMSIDCKKNNWLDKVLRYLVFGGSPHKYLLPFPQGWAVYVNQTFLKVGLYMSNKPSSRLGCTCQPNLSQGWVVYVNQTLRKDPLFLRRDNWMVH